MIKMLCGILCPTMGKILVDGGDPYKNRKRNSMNIGVVFGQRTQLWWDLPLCDSFQLLRRIYKIPTELFDERLNYFTSIFNLGSLLGSAVRTLSLGERMKADIIASLLHNPKILFLDEPTIGLDYSSKKAMRDAIKAINTKYNTTIIITTHDMRDVEELCERIMIVDSGKLIYNDLIRNMRNKLGTYRVVEVKQVDDIKYIMDEFENDDVEVIFNANIASIKFSTNSYSTSYIFARILGIYPNKDILVKADDIDDIIERIYQNEESIKDV